MTVLRPIKVVDGDLVEAVQELPRGSVGGDCILCMHLLIMPISVLFFFLFLYINLALTS